MRIRKIENINLTVAVPRDKEIIKKLNGVAPHEYRTCHDLVRYILNLYLDKKISELGITVE